jgi:NADH-dependant formate dehydrogenase delta subunit FdsD
MSMNVEKLARMANQIAANLDYGSHQARAVADTADHLLRFWTPAMREELAEGCASGSVELSGIAAQALDVATRPGSAPQVSGTGGDAG